MKLDSKKSKAAVKQSMISFKTREELHEYTMES